MGSYLTTLISRRRRRVPVFVGLVALAMQLMVPVLHAPHDLGGQDAAIEASSSSALHTDGCRDAGATRHDPAGCSQCRLVSQLRSVTPLVTQTAAPALIAAWIAGPAGPLVLSSTSSDSGSPRAPPLSV